MKTENLDQYLYRSHSDQTAKRYLYHIDIFKMRRPDASRLKYVDIISYLNDIKKPVKDAYKIGQHFSAMKRYYDYLLETGQRTDHPCRKIVLNQKKRATQLQKLFSPAELELLMNRENKFQNLELRNKVIISLLIYQALTSAELCRLELNDVDLDKGTVYVKGSALTSSRILDLKQNQILLLHEYINTSRKNLLKSNSDKLVITWRSMGETVDGIHSVIESLKGLFMDRSLSPSTIRKSVVSNLLNISKQPLESVQLFAGHKWPSTTEQYRRKDINEQLEKINMWHPLK